jgi:hypothetical protein
MMQEAMPPGPHQMPGGEMMGGPDPGLGGPPPGPGGGLPPELMAALGGGDPMGQDPSMNSQMMMGGEEGMLDPEMEMEDEAEDSKDLLRQAVALLRRAGENEEDDMLSAQIDKIQADAQKILGGEQQKMSTLRSALGG